MDLTFTEEQKLIQRTAREFLEARSPMSHVREMEHDPAGYSTELWKELVEFGWMGLPFPLIGRGLVRHTAEHN
ncbi:MAG: acyl-CoA dehydrogenase family protein, partial [Nitrospiraceae bacterium]